MLSQDQDLLSKPISEITKNKTTNQLKRFLTLVKPIVKVSIDDAKEMGPNFKSIDQYF